MQGTKDKEDIFLPELKLVLTVTSVQPYVFDLLIFICMMVRVCMERSA